MANEENIRTWTGALRSGDYEQGAGALSPKVGKYCCLGVACDVSELGNWGERIADDLSANYVVNGLPTGGSLPVAVAEWLGIDEVDPTLDGFAQASVLNDVERLTFIELADLIEAKYLNNDDNEEAA